MANRFFVTGTDTNVGKTEVSAALLGVMAARGLSPFAFKPFESGMATLDAPADSLRLQRAAGGHQALDTISLFRFTTPVAPAIAARVEHRKTSWATVMKTFRSFGRRAGVVEGAGGLFVPLDAQHDVIDAIAAFRLPVIVVARAGLGTINHTTLTLGALSKRGLPVRAVVLSKSTPGRDASEPFNRAELERRFPSVEFLGPVPFLRSQARRDAALRRVLSPLVSG
ncbi:MAG: dethiobiotin synthase [Myxococcaceae bacterium]|jgi:dethiobiotin synthetase|nr:dethiobiotin synthase [Myxococcaceae bacterium]